MHVGRGPSSMGAVFAGKENSFANRVRISQTIQPPNFNQEWDASMLSNFALDQQLHAARQELSHPLYQHDTACHMIARLKKKGMKPGHYLHRLIGRHPYLYRQLLTMFPPLAMENKLQSMKI